MTEDENRLIRESWAHVMPIADTAASLFYDHLFTIDPSVRPLFANADMAAQRGLGDAWTEETGAAWARAYGLIAEVMQETEAAAV